jgi:crotonobetainyl-CoA:carnitine CoA-transferase CaiB-like acyl-CoA transferase
MEKVFSELLVVELASVLAGPAVGMFFAELGAKVIKIENPKTGGDVTRHWKLPVEDPLSGTSAYYASVNWGKETLFADLTIETEIKKVHDLIKKADIIISNYKAGDAEKFQMDFNTILSINPKIIYAHLQGFPDSSRVAYDVILQAETGFMSMNGTPESGPLKMPVALIDILAAHQLKEAILIALLKRERTEKGFLVTTNLYEAAITSLANQSTNYLMNGVIAKPIGSLHPNISPYGETFITKDRKKLTFAIGSDSQFRDLCKILGFFDVFKEEKFSNNQNRVINRMELFDILQEKIKQLNLQELYQDLIKSNIPVGIIKNIKDVFDDLTNQKSFILEEYQGKINTKRIKTVAFKITDGGNR